MAGPVTRRSAVPRSDQPGLTARMTWVIIRTDVL